MSLSGKEKILLKLSLVDKLIHHLVHVSCERMTAAAAVDVVVVVVVIV